MNPKKKIANMLKQILKIQFMRVYNNVLYSIYVLLFIYLMYTGKTSNMYLSVKYFETSWLYIILPILFIGLILINNVTSILQILPNFIKPISVIIAICNTLFLKVSGWSIYKVFWLKDFIPLKLKFLVLMVFSEQGQPIEYIKERFDFSNAITSQASTLLEKSNYNYFSWISKLEVLDIQESNLKIELDILQSKINELELELVNSINKVTQNKSNIEKITPLTDWVLENTWEIGAFFTCTVIVIIVGAYFGPAMGDLISVQKKSIHQITKLTETVDSINNKVITNEKILNNINDQIAKMDKNVLSNNLEIADNLKISSEILSYVTDTLNMIGNNKMAVDTHYVDLNTSLEKLLMLKTGLINLQKVTILTRAELSQHLDQVILYYQKK